MTVAIMCLLCSLVTFSDHCQGAQEFPLIGDTIVLPANVKEEFVTAASSLRLELRKLKAPIAVRVSPNGESIVAYPRLQPLANDDISEIRVWRRWIDCENVQVLKGYKRATFLSNAYLLLRSDKTNQSFLFCLDRSVLIPLSPDLTRPDNSGISVTDQGSFAAVTKNGFITGEIQTDVLNVTNRIATEGQPLDIMLVRSSQFVICSFQPGLIRSWTRSGQLISETAGLTMPYARVGDTMCFISDSKQQRKYEILFIKEDGALAINERWSGLGDYDTPVAVSPSGNHVICLHPTIASAVPGGPERVIVRTTLSTVTDAPAQIDKSIGVRKNDWFEAEGIGWVSVK